MTILKKLIFVGLFFVSCKINIAQSTVKLGRTHYFMTLQPFYKIEKKQGIDYTTFYLLKKSQPDSFRSFVMMGCCVGTIGNNLRNAVKIDSIKQIILGQTAQWTIYSLDSSYLAETMIPINDAEKAVFGIKAKNRYKIDILISTFGTLRKSK
ncbi:MAG TPA: hypothetical protein VKR53_08310 [Puia sp.]|nr:hypothetical protein [Puia sp.]